MNYPTHSEAAYPEILCDRMSSILLAIVLAQGAFVATDLQQHAQSHGKTLNRVVLEHCREANTSSPWCQNLDSMSMSFWMPKPMKALATSCPNCPKDQLCNHVLLQLGARCGT